MKKISEIVINVFCKTGQGGGVDPTCSIGGGGSNPTAAIATSKRAETLSKKAGGDGLELAKSATKKAEAGDYHGAANDHKKAARVYSSEANKLIKQANELAKAGDRKGSDSARFKMYDQRDAGDAHKKAADEMQKIAGGVSGTVKKGGIHHVGENERAISHTAHDGKKNLSIKQMQKELKDAGLDTATHDYSGSSIGEKGNGHNPKNSVSIRKPSGQVRKSLEQAGYKQTQVHNLPSASGGKNHQETFVKGKKTVTIVDYGYGETTIRISTEA